MFTILAKDLKPVLSGLAKVVSIKASLECLRCIRIDALPNSVTFTGTDLSLTASVTLRIRGNVEESFLVPIENLKAAVRTTPANMTIGLEAGRIATAKGTDWFRSPKLVLFPNEPTFHAEPVLLPETFPTRFAEAMHCSSTDETRFVLNGTLLEASSPEDRGHYLVATNGNHLFSANSFTLPLKASVIIPNHKMLLWRGLEGPWALACQENGDRVRIRIVAGNWTITTKVVEGNYPNWRQVVPHPNQFRTKLILPDGNEFSKLLPDLAGADLKNKPVDISIKPDGVALCDTTGKTCIPLKGAEMKGPEVTVRLNRDYLGKALDYGLTTLNIIDGASPVQFACEGRQMVVMPLRVTVDPIPEEDQPAPSEPQPERKPMPETIGHTNGANRSTTPVIPADKPALEAAIDKLDAFKVTVRETLNGLNELSTLLRQALRDQKAGEKEVNNVRHTLRSLQSVRI